MPLRQARALTALLMAAVAVSSAWAAQVEVFSPQGEVKGVRQVAARFSEPMVAFGDPRLADPFDIDCAQPGAARWADQKNWVFDFERDLPAGVRCSFSVKPDLKALSGAPVEPQQFSFTTGGPAVDRSCYPIAMDEVDEEQMFILGLDAPVKRRHGARPRLVRRRGYLREDWRAGWSRGMSGARCWTPPGLPRRWLHVLCSRTDAWRAIARRDLLARHALPSSCCTRTEAQQSRGAVALRAPAAHRRPAAADLGAGHRVAVGRADRSGSGAASSRCGRRSPRRSPASA